MNLRELIGVLGHELRTPLAAILGYQELLSDGIYGELDAKKKEPLERIQISAHQLLNLIDGLQELTAPGTGDDQELVPTNTTSLIALVEAALRPLAQNRGVKLEVSSATPVDLSMFPEQRFLRAADLAGGAAIKTSAGRTLHLSIHADNGSTTLVLDRTGLVPGTDDPRQVFDQQTQGGPPVTAAQLRLAMAAATLAVVHGSVRLEPRADGSALFLQLPVRSRSD
jgi:light-regulated signal transduction histidine kinase (bacteriophytochrome)